MNYFQEVAHLFTKKEKRLSILLFVMIVFMALFDIIGIASLMPFMAVIGSPDIINSNSYLNDLYLFLDFKSEQDFLLFLGFFVFFALIFSIFFRACTQWFILRFAYMRAYSMSSRLVQGYLFQPYGWFLKRHTGEIGKNILGEVDQVVMGAVIPLMQAVAQVVVLIAIFIFLVAIDPTLAITVALVLSLTYSIIFIFLRNKLTLLGESRVEANKQRYKTLLEMFGGIKEVKVSGFESNFVKKFKPPALKFSKAQSGSQIFAEMPKYALEMIAFGGMLLIVLFIMSKTNSINTILPTISAYVLAAYRMMPALQLLFRNVSVLRFNGPALRKLASEFDNLAEERDPKSDSHKVDFTDSISIRNLSFTYEEASDKSLDNINVNIPYKSSFGIVGSTGSGKTTFIDILLGLLKSQSGSLIVDGLEINESNSVNWRKGIGYVPQDIYLVDDTIEANIAFGINKDDIKADDVKAAAKMANLHTFIENELKDGYKTIVGERGVRLSGGQKQRIGIARALYFKPNLLILDEATSALDNVTEKHVMKSIESLNDKITLIIIAHRLSTIKNCDQILIFEKGKLQDQGTFNELLQTNDIFKNMNDINTNND